LRETPNALRRLAEQTFAERPETGAEVALVAWPADAEEVLATALLYEAGECPWEQARAEGRRRGFEWRRRGIEEALRRRGPHDQPLRALEHLYYTFEILVDYGAFRDLQRHRMATQTTQLLTTEHGYSTPEALAEFGLRDAFDRCMER